MSRETLEFALTCFLPPWEVSGGIVWLVKPSTEIIDWSEVMLML